MGGETIFCKIHEKNNLRVLAVADEELVGKTLADGKICLNVSEKFYKEKTVDEKKLHTLLKEFDNINLIGKKAVQVALKDGLIDEKNIIMVKNIPHVQIFKI